MTDYFKLGVSLSRTAAKRATDPLQAPEWTDPPLHPEEHAAIENAVGRKLTTPEARIFLKEAQNLAAIGLRLAERKDLA